MNYKIIGKRQNKILIQCEERIDGFLMARVADIETKKVSSLYRSLHIWVSHKWNLNDGKVTINEIMNYSGFENDLS